MDPITIAIAFINGWKIGGFIGKLFSTTHAHDIQMAFELIQRFEDNCDPALLRRAIEYLERVDDSDKKYAQCQAYNGIAYCYLMLSAQALNNERFNDALSYIGLGERYPHKINEVEITFLTMNGDEIVQLKSDVPATLSKFKDLKQEILRKKAEYEERQRRNSISAGSSSSDINWKTVAVCAAVMLVIAVIAVLVVVFV